jgi:feruloyl esterase
MTHWVATSRSGFATSYKHKSSERPAGVSMVKVASVLALVVLPAAAWAASPSSCEDLAHLNVPHTVITEASRVDKGAFPAPQGQNGQVQNAELFANLSAFCRVKATLRPTADSDIKIEVWLPADTWNGRLEAVGNGAFQSTISYGALAQAVKSGYAGVGSNTGHEGNSGAVLIGHPEKVIDWGNRAVHEMTLAAKAVVTARYGSPAKYSYWNSCSTGGRQGLVAAEYYPNDFDGLAVGDAANPMTRNQASTLYGSLTMNKSAASSMSPAKWDAYRQAVVNACDASDGVKDGLLNNPLSCHFKPQQMLCKNGDHDDCLTAAQIAALNTLLAGMKNPRTGEQLHAGWPVGAHPANFVVGPKPEDVAIDTFRVIFQDPAWDFHTMDFDRDIARSDQLGNPVMNAADPSRLKALFAHGGKLFMYHGWDDGSITPLQAIRYYNKAVEANGGRQKTYGSIRLFMVPGMGHCQGGEGPNEFDKMEVISQWTEQGKAPDRIIAAHSTDHKVDRTRPLCPYPQIAKYQGAGSTDDAASFVCAKP